ncbi:MAG: phospholipid/cholesterol/gamma-HCH transport system substrate-binding protein, partial [Mycobacterium sp.]|nr:phospholipid/cholesterol/gamma-HCH transport system substrate-binding protein [Mycobacterium sp.]
MAVRKLRAGESRVHPAWWTLGLILVLVGVVVLVGVLFTGSYRSYVPVTLKSERSGLIMEPGNDVKLRGVVVGRVDSVQASDAPVSLMLDINSDQVKYIPANVEAEIKATTAFGNKFVEL